jgi:hypothetical protein
MELTESPEVNLARRLIRKHRLQPPIDVAGQAIRQFARRTRLWQRVLRAYLAPLQMWWMKRPMGAVTAGLDSYGIGCAMRAFLDVSTRNARRLCSPTRADSALCITTWPSE